MTSPVISSVNPSSKPAPLQIDTLSMASSLLRAASRRSKTSLIPSLSGFDPILSESQRSMCSNVRPDERRDGIGGCDLSKYPSDKIRNLSTLSHVDHVKSTLADRLPELTGTIKMGHRQPQYLDKLQGSNLLKSRVVVFPQTVTCSFIRDDQLNRCMSTAVQPDADFEGEDVPSAPAMDTPYRVKFKRLDKTAKQIMTILDKEAVKEVRSEKEIPDIRPGCIVQLKVEVPENKRRVSTLKGIVIARRNAGLNTTFRLRRLVAGVGVESVFPLYSPNIKEMKILDRKKVRRAKLYYLRDRMNALKK